MPSMGTGMRSPRYTQVSKGVAATATSVEAKVIATDRATSARAR